MLKVCRATLLVDQKDRTWIGQRDLRCKKAPFRTTCEPRIRKLNRSRGPACLASLMRSIKNPKHAAIFRQMAKESWADIIALNSLVSRGLTL
ncbi:hypothetical protein DTO013E5_4969 [Penicillium roqueforti]|nr:hypothetical protein DTO012A1_3508 [Penicillium roqueforti]KAI2755452.1 hypothetical protein DTO013F2_1135 [Penicillium roqueforti]KAI2768335.1 hypothetical protein DTO012A8_6503 [Penicillium roqueforti]KAI3076949.1 hypothetical protein CBS147339_4919 [Penicillium roqueforti]KAI3103498.1 hypothetical protein CBS147338_2027 [Penicillium roqueforti]